MALIPCPSCGEQISDKAATCVHCGHVLTVEEAKKVCSECGAELEAEATVCSKCGCPVESEPLNQDPVAPQQVEITKVSIKPQIGKKIIIIVAVAVLAIAGIILGVKLKATNDAAKLSATYQENLNSAYYLMLNGAADAENCGNLVYKVWYNCIHEEHDEKTDKYTTVGGYSFFSDFNVALNKLFSDSDYQSKIDGIKQNQKAASILMKELRNPPEEWEDAYDDLQAYYNSYITLTNLAISPKGSLNTFSSNFNDADSEVLKCLDRMKLYIS
ncbi:MAG: zinc ribbon domain-containing protein [Oscillospiraceae bacterium]|nr:zinc ribbon domain-containing protein [Oscillospiraceae bacterium]